MQMETGKAVTAGDDGAGVHSFHEVGVLVLMKASVDLRSEVALNQAASGVIQKADHSTAVVIGVLAEALQHLDHQRRDASLLHASCTVSGEFHGVLPLCW